MYKQKTKVLEESIEAVLDQAPTEKKKEDGYVLLDLFRKATGYKGKVWSGNMLGFGRYHYKYASGQEGEYFITGYAVRKANITLYLMLPEEPQRSEYIKDLGKYKVGKSCLYINKLADIDIGVLEKMIVAAVDYVKETYTEVKED